MSISTKLSNRFKSLSPEARKKLTKMCWSDKLSFKEIQKKFDFSPGELEKFMRYELEEKDFKRWMLRRARCFNQKSKKSALLRFHN